MKSILNFSISVVFLALLAYGAFHLFHIDAGQFIDWAIGMGAFLWLVIIVTVPWNAHFKAREALDTAAVSRRNDIKLMEDSLQFAKKVARRSLWVAIGLHLGSAVGLYLVASMGVSQVGYFAAALAAGLAFVRPSIRLYEYLQVRLTSIKKEFRFPREDINSLRKMVDRHEHDLSTDEKGNSWRSLLEKRLEDFAELVEKICYRMDEYFEENNQRAEKLELEMEAGFTEIKSESQQNMEKLMADNQLLESVRTLAGFVREMKGGN